MQSPSVMALLYEGGSRYRQIFLDGRQLPQDPNPAWMGYSVGRCEGDTLVVESTGYNDRTWLELGYPHTEGLRITERFRRVDHANLEIMLTIDDPKAYTAPWSIQLHQVLVTDSPDLLDYNCTENERDAIHLAGK